MGPCADRGLPAFSKLALPRSPVLPPEQHAPSVLSSSPAKVCKGSRLARIPADRQIDPDPVLNPNGSCNAWPGSARASRQGRGAGLAHVASDTTQVLPAQAGTRRSKGMIGKPIPAVRGKLLALTAGVLALTWTVSSASAQSSPGPVFAGGAAPDAKATPSSGFAEGTSSRTRPSLPPAAPRAAAARTTAKASPPVSPAAAAPAAAAAAVAAAAAIAAARAAAPVISATTASAEPSAASTNASAARTPAMSRPGWLSPIPPSSWTRLAPSRRCAGAMMPASTTQPGPQRVPDAEVPADADAGWAGAPRGCAPARARLHASSATIQNLSLYNEAPLPTSPSSWRCSTPPESCHRDQLAAGAPNRPSSAT